MTSLTYEPRCEKTCPQGFQPGQTQTVQQQKIAKGLKFQTLKDLEGLYYLAKTNTMISFAVTAKLICVFVFAFAKIRFSHEAAHIFSQ